MSRKDELRAKLAAKKNQRLGVSSSDVEDGGSGGEDSPRQINNNAIAPPGAIVATTVNSGAASSSSSSISNVQPGGGGGGQQNSSGSTPSPSIDGLRIGMRVKTARCDGTLMFLGETQFQKGVWAGVFLDDPIGKTDGSVRGTRYFTCPPGHGVFLPPQDLKPASIEGGATASTTAAVGATSAPVNPPPAIAATMSAMMSTTSSPVLILKSSRMMKRFKTKNDGERTWTSVFVELTSQGELRLKWSETTPDVQASIVVRGGLIKREGTDPTQPYSFAIRPVSGRPWNLAVERDEDRDEWVAALVNAGSRLDPGSSMPDTPTTATTINEDALDDSPAKRLSVTSRPPAAGSALQTATVVIPQVVTVPAPISMMTTPPSSVESRTPPPIQINFPVVLPPKPSPPFVAPLLMGSDSELVRLLMEDDLSLFSSLSSLCESSLDRQGSDGLSNALVMLFEANGRALKMLHTSLARHITESSSKPEEFVQRQSMPIRLLSLYLRVSAVDYIRAVCQPVLQLATQHAGLLSLAPSDSREVRIIVKGLLTAMADASPGCPASVREVLRDLSAQLSPFKPRVQWEKILVDVVICRTIAAALRAPIAAGLCEDEVPATTLAALQTIATAIRQLPEALDRETEANWPLTHRQALSDMIAALVDATDFLPPSASTISFRGEAEDLQALTKIVNENYEAIVKGLSSYPSTKVDVAAKLKSIFRPEPPGPPPPIPKNFPPLKEEDEEEEEPQTTKTATAAIISSAAAPVAAVVEEVEVVHSPVVSPPPPPPPIPSEADLAPPAAPTVVAAPTPAPAGPKKAAPAFSASSKKAFGALLRANKTGELQRVVEDMEAGSSNGSSPTAISPPVVQPQKQFAVTLPDPPTVSVSLSQVSEKPTAASSLNGSSSTFATPVAVVPAPVPSSNVAPATRPAPVEEKRREVAPSHQSQQQQQQQSHIASRPAPQQQQQQPQRVQQHHQQQQSSSLSRPVAAPSTTANSRAKPTTSNSSSASRANPPSSRPKSAFSGLVQSSAAHDDMGGVSQNDMGAKARQMEEAWLNETRGAAPNVSRAAAIRNSCSNNSSGRQVNQHVSPKTTASPRSAAAAGRSPSNIVTATRGVIPKSQVLQQRGRVEDPRRQYYEEEEQQQQQDEDYQQEEEDQQQQQQQQQGEDEYDEAGNDEYDEIAAIENMDVVIASSVLELDFSRKNLRVLPSLVNFGRLHTLCIAGNPIIRNLSRLPVSLLHLDASDCMLSEISGLSELCQLEILRLCGNEIREIDGLRNNSNLVELHLDQNKIEAVRNLSHLRLLRVLSLGQNLISSLQSIQVLKFNNVLHTLILDGNPGCRLKNYVSTVIETLPQLQILDGIETAVLSKQVATRYQMSPAAAINYMNSTEGYSPEEVAELGRMQRQRQQQINSGRITPRSSQAPVRRPVSASSSTTTATTTPRSKLGSAASSSTSSTPPLTSRSVQRQNRDRPWSATSTTSTFSSSGGRSKTPSRSATASRSRSPSRSGGGGFDSAVAVGGISPARRAGYRPNSSIVSTTRGGAGVPTATIGGGAGAGGWGRSMSPSRMPEFDGVPAIQVTLNRVSPSRTQSPARQIGQRSYAQQYLRAQPLPYEDDLQGSNTFYERDIGGPVSYRTPPPRPVVYQQQRSQSAGRTRSISPSRNVISPPASVPRVSFHPSLVVDRSAGGRQGGVGMEQFDSMLRQMQGSNRNVGGGVSPPRGRGNNDNARLEMLNATNGKVAQLYAYHMKQLETLINSQQQYQNLSDSLRYRR